MKWLIIDQVKKLVKHPFELIVMMLLVFFIVGSFMVIHPLSSRLKAPVDRYLETQNVEDFHITMGMIDFNHLTGAQRLDVYQTMNLYSRFPALDESNPQEMNAINLVIQEEIFSYPDLVNRIYDAMIIPVAEDNFVYEKSFRVRIEDERFLYRFISVNESINRPYLTEGTLPNDGEIVLLEPFGKSRDLSIGDTWEIKGTPYTISGFFYAPQYILPALEASSMNYDERHHAIVLATDEDILRLGIPFRVDYQAVGDFKTLSDDFDVYDILQTDFQTYGRNMRLVETVVPRDFNYRIHSIIFEADFTETFVFSFLGVFMGLSAFVLVLFIKQYIDRQKADITLLKQLGYSHNMIASAFLVLAFSLILVVTFATFVGLLVGNHIFSVYTAKYVMPKAPFTFPLASLFYGWLLLSILIPVIIYLYTRYRLYRLTVYTVITKWKMVYHTLKTRAVEWLIFFVIGTLLLTSLFARTLIDDFIDETLKGKYFEEMVYLYQFEDTALKNTEEPFIHYSVQVLEINNHQFNDATYVQGYGLSPTTTLLALKDDNIAHNRLLNDGVFISENMAYAYDINSGDTIILGVGYVTETFTVIGIADEWTERAVYIDYTQFVSMIGFDNTDLYNGFFTQETDTDQTYNYRTLNYKQMVDEIEQVFAISNQLVGYFVILSIFLGMMMLYFYIRQSLLDILPVLLTLKALGYNTRETYLMFFKQMFGFLFIAFIFSIVSSIWLIEHILAMIHTRFGLIFPFALSYGIIIMCFMAMGVILVISTYTIHKTFSHISLSQVLKKA